MKGYKVKKLDYNQLKKVMQECLEEVGVKKWLNKESVIFRLKAKYGDIFDKEESYKIYDEIYGKFMEEHNCK